MKIFIVNPGMVDDYIFALATELGNSGQSVYLFGGTDYEGRKINFINFNYYNHLFNANKIKPLWLRKILKACLYVYLQFYLLSSIKKEKPDIVHLQWARIPLFDNIFIKFFQDHVPIVFTLHNTSLNHGDKSFLQKIFNYGFKSFLNSTSSIILHTNYSRQKFEDVFPEFKEKIEKVAHGLLDFPPAKELKKFNFPFKSEKVLLFFGNIEKYKGLDILISAMPYLKDENIKLLVAGRPHIDIGLLKNLAKDLDVCEKIHWHTSYIENEYVSEIYDSADLIILPHRHIDQSGILMTAINFGKPIIASDTGGFSEIIENVKHGYLFEPGNSKDLALKVLKALAQDKTHEMEKEVLSLKKSWKSWKEISIKTLRIYKRVLDN